MKRSAGIHGKVVPVKAVPPVGQRVSVGEVVTPRTRVEWFKLLDKSLVGRVGGRGVKGVRFGAMRDWVRRWWKISGQVKVRSLGGSGILVCFSDAV